MSAVQTRDNETLENILDPQFVCTAWSSIGELTTRDEYLASVQAAEFRCFHLVVDHVQRFADTAVVRCSLQCDCAVRDRTWRVTFLTTDVWAHRGDVWKVVARHASIPFGQQLPFPQHVSKNHDTQSHSLPSRAATESSR